MPSLSSPFPTSSQLGLCILQSRLYVLDQGIGETLAPWAVRASLLSEFSTLSSLVTIDGFFLAQASLELTTNDLEFLILLPSAGTTSMYHHAWLLAHFFLFVLFSYFTFSLCF